MVSGRLTMDRECRSMGCLHRARYHRIPTTNGLVLAWLPSLTVALEAASKKSCGSLAGSCACTRLFNCA